MNRKVVKLYSNQANIQSLFQVASKKTTHSVIKPNEFALMSDNPDIQAFYNSLNPSERIAHTIAIEQLGTSYNVTRTHGYQKWKKMLST